MIPPEIQTFEQLQSRYPAALESLFDYESMIVGVSSPPEECPANVFDCENGVRLVIFRENVPGSCALVIRAYLLDGYPEILKKLLELGVSRGLGDSLDSLSELVESLFRKISGNTQPLIFLGFSEWGHTPTWVQEFDGCQAPGRDSFDQEIEFHT